MKTVLSFVFVLAFSLITFAQTPDSSYSAEKDTVIKDPFSSTPILLGYCNRDTFKDTTYSWWFNSMYDVYNIDSATADQLVGKLKDVDIKIVMGTWCSDSRREVPRFFRILDYLKYPDDNVKIIAVGRDKQGRGNETKNLDIEMVPTFIFYRDGKEIGRIIESPKVSLEKDMLKILG